MTFDLIVRNGTIVDGTGAPAFRADVAVAGGRLAAIGSLDGAAARTVLDATDRIVTPGFIDPHTHYDAQVCWDRRLDASASHGVTTVIMGNCGVGVAPCRPLHRDFLIQDLVNVESMSAAVLDAGIDWCWESFPEYMDAIDRRGIGINCALLAPLAPFRTYVLGPEASDRPADAAERGAISALLAASLDAGAFGFSTSAIPTHVGHNGRPLAARMADRAELAEYCGLLRARGRGTIELALVKLFGRLADDECELISFLARESGRPVTWLSLDNLAEDPDNVARMLEKAAPLIRAGALPQIMTRPLIAEMSLSRPFHFGEMQSAKALFGASVETQKAIYADAGFRRAFRDELALGRKFTNQARHVTVLSVANRSMAALEGKSIGDIACERGASPEDTLFDVGVADDLATVFLVPRANTSWERIPEQLRMSGTTLLGLSDAGAHVDMFCEAGYPTWLLGYWVREKQALSIEHAIKRLTSEPADYFGIRDRGRLAPGLAADIVVMDPATVGSPVRGTLRRDLPAGGARLVAEATGVDAVIVNGTVLIGRGASGDALPGRVLRSA